MFCLYVKAQVNLVPNGSFEDTLDCATHWHQPAAAIGWFNPTLSTPDYYSPFLNCGYSSLSGFQSAHSGEAYCGIYTFIDQSITREYLEIKLTDSLVQGVVYKTEFYVSRADYARYSTDAIGIYFSSDSIADSTFGNLQFFPQVENASFNIISDTITWVKVSGQFIANGGEKFVTIGNFYDNSNTNYTIDSGNFSIEFGAYYFIDDVFVGIDSIQYVIESDTDDKLSVYPNPVFEQLNIKASKGNIKSIMIYDLMGEIAFSSENSNWKNNANINLKSIRSGMYFLICDFYEYTIVKKIIKI